MLRALADLLPERGVVVGRERVAEDLDVGPVVAAGDGLHQVGRGVVAKVGADVPDAKAGAVR